MRRSAHNARAGTRSTIARDLDREPPGGPVPWGDPPLDASEIDRLTAIVKTPRRSGVPLDVRFEAVNRLIAHVMTDHDRGR